MNVQTGQVLPATCKRNGCEVCGPRKASVIGGALLLGRPQRLLTLTRVGTDWQTIRSRVRRFGYLVRDEGYRWELAFHVEPNPSGDGEHHVHGYQRGDFIPQRRVSAIADRCGMGFRADIRRFRPRGRTATYGVKLAGLGYGMKGSQENLAAYLKANGGRFVHTTRGYWLDDQGRRCGQAEAMESWVRTSYDQEGSGEWQFLRREHLPRAVAGRTWTR